MLQTLKTLTLIPARMASTRLPNKPLADICGKPMIVHVADRAAAASLDALWLRPIVTRFLQLFGRMVMRSS